MAMPKFTKGIDHWYWCTSEGSDMFNVLLGFEFSFREKLQWLEEAENLSLGFQKHRGETEHTLSPHDP